MMAAFVELVLALNAMVPPTRCSTRCSRLQMCTAGSTARAAAQELRVWVEEQGGSSSVVAGPTEHGLGLLAAKELAAGAVAIKIPKECLLSASAMPERLARLHDAVPAEFWAARLGLVLLAERCKGEDSKLAAYIATLPAAYTVPLFWTPDAISRLKYPPLQARLVKRARFVQSFASGQLAGGGSEDAFGGVSVGADALGWAIAACSSRAAMVGSERVLCPIIDIGNHAPKGAANTEIRATLGGALELVCTRPIGLGEEVTYDYGELTSDDFLLDYGFLPPANEHDTASLAWAEGGLLQSAASAAGIDVRLADWQRVAMRTSGLTANLEALSVTRDGLEEQGMVACRIAAAPDAAAFRSAKGGRAALRPASAEARAYKLAAAMVAIALTSFPEDEGVAADETTHDAGLQLARQFMEEKRQLCKRALAALGERIKAIQSGEARAEFRGHHKAKLASGVRKQSARAGTAAKRPKSGFGSR